MWRCTRAVFRVVVILALSLTLNFALLFFCFNQRRKNAVSSLFFRWILNSCNIKIHIQLNDELNSFKTRSLIVSNHVSYLDILIISSIFPCVFLAKSEVREWPVFGWVARSLGCIFVRRDSLMGRANALRKSIERIQSSNVAIFPEGTTTALSNPQLDAWTAGHGWIAQKAGLNRIICLKLTFENQEERAWTDDTSLLPHLFETLKQDSVKVTLSIRTTEIALNSNARDLRHQTWKAVIAEGAYAGT